MGIVNLNMKIYIIFYDILSKYYKKEEGIVVWGSVWGGIRIWNFYVWVWYNRV
jgi:hypothetical protein